MDTTKNLIQSSDVNQKKCERHQFLKLSLAERKRILEEQAEKMLKYYEENQEGREAEIGDLINE